MSSNVVSFIKTKEELTAFKEGIGDLISVAYKQDNNNFLSQLKKDFDEIGSQVILERIKGLDNSQDVEKSLRTLISELENIEEIKIILSFRPKLAFIERLSTWFKNQYGQNTILDISQDPSILGGIVIVHNGKYIDLSLKQKLDEYFINNYDKIKSHI